MPLLLLPQGGAGASASFSFSDVLSEIYPKLNAVDEATLVYWTDAELLEWADESAKRLARKLGVFVERDASTAISLGVPTYTLPARHVSTIHASIAGVSLAPSNVQEVEALDATWVETTGATDRFLNDNLGTAQMRVYPTPNAGVTGALAIIFHRFPVTITAANLQLSAPECMREYFSWRMLAEARRKESDASMLEVADHFDQRAGLMEQVIEKYWGQAQ